MLLFRFFTWLATIFAAALAAPPIVQRQPAPGPDPQKAYYLKAKVIGGDRSEDGLYLTAEYAGAGYGFGAFAPQKDLIAYCVNDGQFQEFWKADYIWHLSTVHENWSPVSLGPGNLPESGFVFKKTTGLEVKFWSLKPEGHEGWLVCDWVLRVPQLFSLVKPQSANDTYPKNCAEIRIWPEMFNSSIPFPHWS